MKYLHLALVSGILATSLAYGSASVAVNNNCTVTGRIEMSLQSFGCFDATHVQDIKTGHSYTFKKLKEKCTYNVAGIIPVAKVHTGQGGAVSTINIGNSSWGCSCVSGCQ